MGDILSQNEIDDLLKALTAGEIDVQQMQTKTQEKKIKLHDFQKPNKFAKDHLKTLQLMHENYARLLTTFLTGYLRTLVQVEVIPPETMPYRDFSNSIISPVILAIVDFSPLRGSILIEIAPVIAYALIDRILGGKGLTVEKIREFTEIEMAIIERVISQILNLMKEPWENIVPIKPRLEEIETNAQFAQIISPTEMVALVTLMTKIGDIEGMINICIPHLVVEPIMPKLSTRLWFTTIENETSSEQKEAIERRIENTWVPLKTILGRTTITVEEALELSPGDVIPLDTNVNGNVQILVGDLLKFYATPGVKRNRVSVKITDIIKKEVD